MSKRFFCFSLLAGVALLGLPLGQARAADPDMLWKTVSGECLLHYGQDGNPSPCVQLDPRPEAGYALLKDHVGVAQFLVIPTTRVTGVESPALLAEGAPNYWEYAWQAKAFVEKRLPRPLKRDEVALAVNSVFGRSQNQLHIHVDCIRADVRDSLHRDTAEIGTEWAPLRQGLRGHRYWAMRIAGRDLGDNNPFKLLAGRMDDARQHMDRHTLVLTGAVFEDGSEGFILLADQIDPLTADRASGEELLDHDCALAAQ